MLPTVFKTNKTNNTVFREITPIWSDVIAVLQTSIRRQDVGISDSENAKVQKHTQQSLADTESAAITNMCKIQTAVTHKPQGILRREMRQRKRLEKSVDMNTKITPIIPESYTPQIKSLVAEYWSRICRSHRGCAKFE